MSNNENKKSIENLKNQEIDGENTKGGTSITSGTSFHGGSNVPFNNGLGDTNVGIGATANPLGVSTGADTNPSADVKPLDDFSSDQINSGSESYGANNDF